MATVLLTVAGGAIGGPIGAAIGGALGQAVDRSLLFSARPRQGPRLTELAVQTSSYGSAVPRLHGTLRVAGTVIWATDLQERRETSRGGKGQPGVTQFSYSASFAVLLSGRRIAGVRRIWADGKLLRGAAGDWKSTLAAFRLHPGTEAQLPDPLIAAAEGAAVPACRGQAVAVFEHLQLADFGNRLPSLTFEVVADTDAVTVGSIVADATGGRVPAGEATLPLTGFAVAGDSMRAVIDGLIQPTGVWLAREGGATTLRAAAGAATTVADQGAAGARGARTVAPAARAPAAVSLGYYDSARDYQTGVQRAVRAGARGPAVRIDLPAVLDAAAARAIAESAIVRLDREREVRRVALDWDALALRPGDRVEIAGEAGQWRIVTWLLEGMAVTLTLSPIGDGVAVQAADGGRAATAEDHPHGPTLLTAIELPPGDAPATGVAAGILAAGVLPGWRRAALLTSADAGERWSAIGGTAAPAVLGITATPLPPASPLLEDHRSVLEVQLAHGAMQLESADGREMAAGANLAMIGDELVQFARAEQIDTRRWRLSRLWRGRRGSAPLPLAPGARFVLLDPAAVREVPVEAGAASGTLLIAAQGVGDPPEGTATQLALTGWALRPPAPVHARAVMTPDGLHLSWTRSSRAGWQWRDGVDVPLGEERESYAVTLEGAGGVRRLACTRPELTLAESELPPRPFAVRIEQLGDHARSPATLLTFD